MARTAPSLGPKQPATPTKNRTAPQASSAQAYSNTGTQDTVKLTFELPQDLHKALKIRALEEETSMRAIIEKLVRAYLAGNHKTV